MAGQNDVVDIAWAMVKACGQGDFAAAYARASPALVAGVPATVFAESWAQMLRLAGKFKSIDSATSYKHLLAPAPVRQVMVECTFAKTKIEVQVGFDQDDQIIGVAFLAPTPT